jgi:hypothetical protein
MAGEPGVDHPEAMAVVDVLAASRGDAVMSFVQAVTGSELVLTVGQDRSQRRVRLEPGERLELVWKGPEELRSLPAELVSVDTGGSEPTWRVTVVGKASRGQRRAAVRAPLDFRAELVLDKAPFEGVTVDISEGGMRCLLDVPGDAEPGRGPSVPEVGTVVPVAVHLDGGRVRCQAEIVRRHRREDRRAELSVRFIGLPEPDQDTIRRNVFAGLRDLRSRGLI